MKLRIKEVYSQRDPEWKNVLLGFNTSPQYNLGDFGCLVSTVAMYLSALDYKENPETLNSKLKNVSGFVNGGYYVWSALEKIYSDVVLSYQSKKYDGLDDEAIERMKYLLDNGYPLICEVDFNPSLIGDQMHWVLVYGYEGGNFFIADPWRGALVNLSVYGDLKNAVTSFKTYSRTLPKDSLDDATPPQDNPCKQTEQDKEYWKDEAKKAREKANKRQDEIDNLVKAQQTMLLNHKTDIDNLNQVHENEMQPLKQQLKEQSEYIGQFSEIEQGYKDKIKELQSQEYTLDEALSFMIQYFIRKIKSFWYTTEVKKVPSVEELERETENAN